MTYDLVNYYLIIAAHFLHAVVPCLPSSCDCTCPCRPLFRLQNGCMVLQPTAKLVGKSSNSIASPSDTFSSYFVADPAAAALHFRFDSPTYSARSRGNKCLAEIQHVFGHIYNYFIFLICCLKILFTFTSSSKYASVRKTLVTVLLLNTLGLCTSIMNKIRNEFNNAGVTLVTLKDSYTITH